MKYSLPLLMLGCLVAVSPTRADCNDSCGRCGCCQQVRKVCRIVCEMEEKKEVTWCCECEDFCTPGPSKKCGCKEIPSCGKVRTRHKLVKKEEVKKVPTYKCVVEYLCPTCCAGCATCIAPPPTAAQLSSSQSYPAAQEPRLTAPGQAVLAPSGFSLAPVVVEPAAIEPALVEPQPPAFPSALRAAR